MKIGWRNIHTSFVIPASSKRKLSFSDFSQWDRNCNILGMTLVSCPHLKTTTKKNGNRHRQRRWKIMRLRESKRKSITWTHTYRAKTTNSPTRTQTNNERKILYHVLKSTCFHSSILTERLDVHQALLALMSYRIVVHHQWKSMASVDGTDSSVCRFRV